MFFNLSDGSRIKAKTTKKGQHLYGVTFYSEFKATAGERAGEMVGFYGLASQHMTLQAAESACKRFLKDSPTVVAASVVKAA